MHVKHSLIDLYPCFHQPRFQHPPSIHMELLLLPVGENVCVYGGGGGGRISSPESIYAFPNLAFTTPTYTTPILLSLPCFYQSCCPWYCFSHSHFHHQPRFLAKWGGKRVTKVKSLTSLKLVTLSCMLLEIKQLFPTFSIICFRNTTG